MKYNNEQMEEYEVSCFIYILEKKATKNWKRMTKQKDNFEFMIYFAERQCTSFLNLYEFFLTKQDVSTLLPEFYIRSVNFKFF